MLAGSRVLYRIVRERMGGQGQNIHAVPVLLVGYKNNAEQFVRDLQRTPSALYRVVGLLDDDASVRGRLVHGVQILGGITEMSGAVAALEAKGERPQRVILSEDYLEPEKVAALLEQCAAAGLSLARLPRLTDFLEGTGEEHALRPVAIEDILGRAQHVHDRARMHALIHGNTVLITGAGGTIGGELARQAAGFAPRRLVLLDASEYNLYRIDQEIAALAPQVERVAVLGDVRDREGMAHEIGRFMPQVLFHAAAIKHVPLAEENVAQAVLTNVFGTRNVMDAAALHGVATAVMISTDKAVHPANIMGATKRLAEHYCQICGTAEAVTRFITVRFGNVLGSTGSVVPLFQRQLAAGGPITVTHPEMERFFMTVREAVELVIVSATLAAETEVDSGHGITFVLDMGKPVKIRDLAVQMIRLAGLRPEEDVKIEYTGLRAGEKLYEELFYATERVEPTRHAGLMRAQTRTDAPRRETLEQGLALLLKACETRDERRVRAEMQRLVPEFVSGVAGGAA
jgi:O-antigen biosynthesis protein WbqV